MEWGRPRFDFSRMMTVVPEVPACGRMLGPDNLRGGCPLRHTQPEPVETSMSHFHAVVWLDHQQAHVVQFSRDAVETIHLEGSHSAHKRHHHAGNLSGKRTPEDRAFFDDIIAGLGDAQEWLIMGPGAAKLEFVKHIHAHHPTLIDRVVGVETSDHPTDGQLAAHARRYFLAADRMLGH